jgi:hypothetical protein
MKVERKLLENRKYMRKRIGEDNEGGNEQNVCVYENITNSLFCIIYIYIYLKTKSMCKLFLCIIYQVHI